MTIEDGLYTYLSSAASVVDVVGSRIHAQIRPQGEVLPAITYQRISSTHERHTTGASGIANARLQIDCWATGNGGYSRAKDLAERVRNAIDGYRGAMGQDTVKSVVLENQTDDYFASDASADVGTYRVSSDYMFWFTESIPTFT